MTTDIPDDLMSTPSDSSSPYTVRPVHGMPEVRPGDDLGELIAARVRDLRDRDIVVVSSKIVSKAEGRIVSLAEDELPPASSAPSAETTSPPRRPPRETFGSFDERVAALRAATIRSEAVRVVAARGATQIVQTRHGFVMAAAGVDASNVAAGSLVLLPLDPDASARGLRHALAEQLGVSVGVVISDTFGRPWRVGQTDLAIGAAGVLVINHHRGRRDAHGNELVVTAPACADEIASAAELAMGKLAQVPVAVVRGLPHLVTAEDGPGVRALIRTADEDLFRFGSREAVYDALTRARTVDTVADGPVDHDVVRRVVTVLQDSPGDGVALVDLADSDVRKSLLDAARLPSSVAYAALLFAPQPVDEHVPALLEVGATRERLAVACAAEGLASTWVPAERLDAALVRKAAPDPSLEPVGLLVVGSHENP
ncbi:MAG TPA: coenzyme F420-0:L-glutamate ligase [Actinopolymorphaceae bacterium]